MLVPLEKVVHHVRRTSQAEDSKLQDHPVQLCNASSHFVESICNILPIWTSLQLVKNDGDAIGGDEHVLVVEVVIANSRCCDSAG